MIKTIIMEKALNSTISIKNKINKSMKLPFAICPFYIRRLHNELLLSKFNVYSEFRCEG